MPISSQLGVKKEVTYGTAVTVDRFAEFLSESMQLETGRAESKALRTGQRVQRSDRFIPYITGVSGSVELEPLSKGFGFWLEHMLGQVATTGPVDGAYTHTASIATLCGKSFTMQANRPFGACGDTNQAFTWEGLKISKWELALDAEGLLTFSADLVGEDESTATALATASYPAGAEVFSWVGGLVTIGGTATDVKSWKVSCDNKLDDGRLFLRENTRRKEPVESDYREITAELTLDFENLTHYNRFKSATAAGTLAAVELQATAATLIGASTYPRIKATIPAARFDEVGVNIGGTDVLEQTVKCVGLFDGTNSPISVEYTTADTTP